MYVLLFVEPFFDAFPTTFRVRMEHIMTVIRKMLDLQFSRDEFSLIFRKFFDQSFVFVAPENQHVVRNTRGFLSLI